MPKREDIKSVLVIGSGPIIIGQACEFDYSGTQACRVLKEEGLRVILVNSNPATIMTDPEFADATYIEPITAEYVEKVIAKERPDALLATLGGQTALNCAIGAGRAGRAREVRRRADRRQHRGHRPRREPRGLQEDRRRARRRERPQRDLPLDGRPARRGRGPRLPDGGPPVVHHGRHRLRHGLRRGGPAPHRRRRPRRQPDHRGAPRGVDPRLEGVRARGHARHGRQRGDHLLHREPRPDGRAHRRLHHRRPGDDADRPRVPEDARPGDRHHPLRSASTPAAATSSTPSTPRTVA